MNRLSAKFALLLILPFILTKCTKDSSTSVAGNEDLPLFTLLSSSETGIDFSNIIEEDPLRNGIAYYYYYNGGGVAIGDLNNDGLPDIFFTGNNAKNRLYINKGNLKFEDISAKAGIQSNHWSTGVTMVDVNNDGLLDIYVCNSGPYREKLIRTNQLYINNGDLTFSDKAAQYGIANTGYSIQSSFFDFDNDGDLDLFIMNHILRTSLPAAELLQKLAKMPLEEKHEHSCNLYINNGNNTFSDISQQAGILKPGLGLGLATSDLNQDGWTDIYVANDDFIPDFMFLNLGNGTFTENINKSTSHISYFSMGIDVADFNNDGLIDIGIVDMTPADHIRNKVLMKSMDVNNFRVLTKQLNYQEQYMFNTLQVNNGMGFFSEIAHSAGVSKTDWSWAPLFADFDNDGLKDYLVTNGFLRDISNNDFRAQLDSVVKNTKVEEMQQRIFELLQTAEQNPLINKIYKNKGNYQFEDMSKEWGFHEPTFSNGAAYADLDLDGDLDIVINNINKPAHIYRNNAIKNNSNNFIRFKLLGKSGKSLAYNSKITIYHDNKMQFVELHPVRGYQSSVEGIIHFGLNNSSKIDSVKIEWLNGTQSILTDLQINETHTISLKGLASNPIIPPTYNAPFIDFTNRLFKTPFWHKENDFDDFAKEILLPHRQSMLGPFVAVGDVNGDQLEDFFVGGAKGQSGQLYLQHSSGQFILSPSQPWNSDKGCEDMGTLFFDVDGDNDLDLYIASGGGGEFSENSPLLQDRLYINDGKGNFKKNPNALPKMPISSGKVKSYDFDGDGDMDLFVAGRTNPGKYPLPVDSYLLRNDNGKFTDVTNQIAPQLRKLGMVTDAVWTDFDQDGLVDLFVVGEWMPVTCFKNDGKQFINVTDQYSLGDKKGWWSSIIAVDIDNDGDEDLIVGNIGSNNKFNPTEEKPLYIYCNDFDDNGTLDIVLSKNYKGNKVPLRGKECSTAQMPFISEKFPTFQSFAESSLSDIYGDDKIDEALYYSANYFYSVFIENKGQEGFEFHKLPVEAQLAPINAIIAKDFNADGNIDLVIGGNNYQTEVETPQYDAGKGLILKGNGDGTFEASLQISHNGLILPFDTKDLGLISIQNKVSGILVANNNNILQFFAYNQDNKILK